MKYNKQAIWETVKFILRMAILAGGPYLLAWTANIPEPFREISAAVLPIIDKWAHENKDVKATGLVPF
jgi:hypothetical protein